MICTIIYSVISKKIGSNYQCTKSMVFAVPWDSVFSRATRGFVVYFCFEAKRCNLFFLLGFFGWGGHLRLGVCLQGSAPRRPGRGFVRKSSKPPVSIFVRKAVACFASFVGPKTAHSKPMMPPWCPGWFRSVRCPRTQLR